MKLWFQKISIVLITFMTLGMFIPPTYLDTNAQSSKGLDDTDADGDLASLSEEDAGLPEDELDLDDDDLLLDDDLIDGETLEEAIERITDEAKEQTLRKLGPKIAKQVEDDVLNAIMPNIEEVLNTIVEQAEDNRYQNFVVAEEPAAGYGERIFNIYDSEANEDVAKFHVRRDNRPKNGYWFNFHYHLSSDGFEEHHELGEVYWDKNTPPKWMS
ncbi:YpjP family protein [Alteribacter aurantiacus]|uniref:YpjP family protein n=1 Tax=Alteribacter aurantiacus TaxID=254410 RepID=UPI000409F2BF|nr:YpjP family protein [Alteribacter aurantiacus]